jgi:hypothetical protein
VAPDYIRKICTNPVFWNGIGAHERISVPTGGKEGTP